MRVGEDVLLLRKEVLNLWDKIILLNPFSYESKNDFILYIGSVLQDHILAKNEEKKFLSLQDEKYPEKDNIYYSMFNQELSAVLLADGYSFNGKIVYTTPNFPYLFMFSEKEIINTSIDDLLPDVIQNFHKFLLEDTIKNSNLAYIYKEQRDSLLKGKNGIIFNINLFVKPVPNLLFGLIFFIYIKKNIDNNFILILDENLIINGFTEINQIGSNFIWGNNYDLTHIINGHHIGLIIPEILLYMNYDLKTNSFFLPKNSIDLKGYLYPINSFKELDERIPLILEELRARKIMEYINENKIGSFEEYDELIKILNIQCFKPHSIFFRIELHSFIGGKYIYYRVYIINDLLNGNENLANSQYSSKTITNKKNPKEYLKQTVMSRIKIKELSEDINNFNINSQDLNQDKKIKIIKIINENKEQNKNKENINSKNNFNFYISNSNNNNNNNINTNQNNTSIIQSNAEPLVFNKIKKHILIKDDCSHVKKMRYLSYIFVPVNIILIIFDFFYTKDAINKMIEFLQQNKYFMHMKISTANIYASGLNLKLLKEGHIHKELCLNKNCTEFYIKIINRSITEITSQKSNIYLFHEDFQEIFNQKLDSEFTFDNTTNITKISLDMNNFLNLLLSHGAQIISYLNGYNLVNEEYFDIYLRNLLTNSLKYFHSDYIRFMKSNKIEKATKVASHYPICICIYMVFILYMSYIYYSYIIAIKDVHIFYFEKLMNFTSSNFELYLKKLDEIKKKFREDTNEEEDKNIDEFDLKDDDEKNDYNSKVKNDEKSKKEENINNKNLKKKKQNKIQQQKIKNKRIISNYLFKTNIFLIIKFGIIFLLSTSYYITTIITTIKMKNNYIYFDSIIEEINTAYYNYYNIFIMFKEQIDNISISGKYSEIIIPEDNEIERPRLGKALIYIIKSSKYSKDNIEIFEKLYNDDACEVLTDNEEDYQICKFLLSSILSKGFEQAIVQISSIITSVIDELKSLKENKTLEDIYNNNLSIFSGYDDFMEYYMFGAYLQTQNIFKEFRIDERSYMINGNKIILLIFCIIYIILFIFLLCYIYSYKAFTCSFLSFIGIIPSKYIADDNEFYKKVLCLDPYYD